MNVDWILDIVIKFSMYMIILYFFNIRIDFKE